MLRGIFLLREVKPSQEHVMIKLLPFENLFFFLANTTFSSKPVTERQRLWRFPAKLTQPSSCARTTQYQEKFVRVVVVAVESNTLY